jgi:hypothetical protein
MQAAEFDLWRDRYAEMTFAEHAEFYRRLHADHPDQKHFCGPDALAFFDAIPSERLIVAELGGYDGALADLCLKSHRKIASWDNFDIAAPDSTVGRGRYYSSPLDVQFWETGIPFEWDTFVASHVIEHLSRPHLEALLDYVAAADWIYLDAPLEADRGRDWRGETCAHALNLSWAEVDALVCDRGFERWPITETAHCYRRSE